MNGAGDLMRADTGELEVLRRVTEIWKGPHCLEESKCCTQLQKGPEEQSGDLQTGWPHFSPWETHNRRKLK